MEEFSISLKGLDCANCANKIERKVNDLNEVHEANVNFSVARMSVTIKDKSKKEELINEITKIVNELEPDVVVTEYKRSTSTIKKAKAHVESIKLKSSDEIKLNLEGLDCANCANKIEQKVRGLQEIEEVNMNFPMKRLSFRAKEEAIKHEIIGQITKIVNELEPDVVVSEYNPSKTKKKEHVHNGKECHCNDNSCSIEGENKERSRLLELMDGKTSLLVGSLIYIIALFFKDNGILSLILFLGSYILIGGNVVLTALKNITRGEIFDENFLMAVATVGALLIGEYPEAVAVMLFYEIGELFQSYAVNTSRKSITSLMNVRADYANLITEDGEKKVTPEEVEVNDIIILKPGERVPLDGVIIEGNGSLDTSALTGESMPREVSVKDEILSGSINLNSVLKVQVTKEFSQSTISRILELVENAGNKKAQTEKFITKFCRYYTPAVVFCAIALAIIPPIVTGGNFSEWIYKALSFLVVSCPCALVISVPLALFAGIGGSSKKGILVKGGNYLEALKDTDIVVFDKTGTLTKGNFCVTKIETNNNISKDELLRIAAMSESFSNHPIAQSIVQEYGKEINKDDVKDYQELSGHGIKAVIDNKKVLVGNYKLMKSNDISASEISEAGTIVYVAIEGKFAGYLIIEDEIKADSKEGIRKLKELGVKKVVMLTGDNKKVAEKVGKELGLDEVYGELLPIDKVEKVEELLTKKKDGKLVFVGDGINDAPVLARADIGVAMGGIGSDAAIEAADVVLMRDSIVSLADSVKIARKTNKILLQNIIFSLGVKIGVLILISLGFANMWEAVFADVGVTLIAVLNSMRALK